MKLLLLSGGLDSTVLFYDLISNNEKFECMWLNYGQKNAGEEHRAVFELCKHNSIKLRCVQAPHIFDGVDSTILNTSAPHSIPHTVESDFLLNRNGVLLNIAAAHCRARTTLLVAAHKSGSSYPDCQKVFYNRISKAIFYSTNCLVDVDAPYIKMTKKQIVKKAWDLALSPLDIMQTVSCYEGNNCGKCPACIARKQALEGIYPLNNLFCQLTK